VRSAVPPVPFDLHGIPAASDEDRRWCVGHQWLGCGAAFLLHRDVDRPEMIVADTEAMCGVAAVSLEPSSDASSEQCSHLSDILRIHHAGGSGILSCIAERNSLLEGRSLFP